MILETIKLHNIRSYVDEEINFPQGSTLLAGDIGTGKSTILLAIEFALFGTAKGQLSGDSLLRKGANEGNVELKFNLNGEEITIKRTLKRRSDSIAQGAGYIINKGTKKEGTAVELKSHMLNILGYPKEMLTKKNDLYRYTVYTPQEAMKHILYDSSDQRQDTLRRIFGIDKYKNIRENTTTFVRFLKEKQKELEIRTEKLQENKELKEKLDQDLNKIEEELKENQKEKEEIEKKLREIRKDAREIEKKARKLNEYKKELSMQENYLSEKLQQISKNKQEIIEIESTIKRIEEQETKITIKEIQKDEKTIEKEIETIQKEINVMREQKSKIEEKISNANKEEIRLNKEIRTRNEQTLGILDKRAEMLAIDQILKSNRDVKENLEKESNELQTIILELSKLKSEEEQTLKILKDMEELKQCPKCRQNVHEDHKNKILDEENIKLNEIKTKIIELDASKEKKKKILDELNEKIKLVEQKEKEKITLDAEIKRQEEIVEEIVKLRTQLSEISREKNEIQQNKVENIDIQQEKLTELNKELKEIQRQKIIQKEKEHLKELMKEKNSQKIKLDEKNQEIKKQIGQINMKKKELNDNVASLKEIEQECNEIETKENKEIEKEKQAEARKASMQKEKSLLDEQMNKLHVEILNQENHKKEKIRLGKIQTWLEKNFNPLTTLIEKHVMTHVHREFDESFKQWFNMLIEDENLSIRLDEEFTPIIIQNSYETEVDNLSGGEKASAALAYRLALNKVINHAIETIKTKDLIILDEPTDGFSLEQLDNVRKVMDELHLGQVIIVSHENKVESFVDNIIRVAKQDHVSRVLA